MLWRGCDVERVWCGEGVMWRGVLWKGCDVDKV